MHLWRVAPARIPAALRRMAFDRLRLRAAPGLTFAKLLGTGNGRTFTVRDATPRRWALVAAWAQPGDAAAFERGPVAAGWARIADESFRADLRPLTSRGRWSGRAPFGPAVPPPPYDGAVAALTRARLRPGKAARFWRAVPPVSTELQRAPGLRLAVGVGEAPIGFQGTFSVWESAAALRAFAYHGAAHRVVIRRTAEERWYAEELFARFAVLATRGTVDRRSPLA